VYNLAALESALAGSIFSGKMHYAPKTASTNSDALAAAREAAPHGSVYLADEQTAGRGRGNHSWHSVAGKGLYVSVLLRPELPPARLPLLPLAAGLAAAAAIHSVSGLTVDLRWPNDLLVGSRKTGGILVEAGTTSEMLPYAVLGIGINVHQREFPAGLATPATSLDLESGMPGDRGPQENVSASWGGGDMPSSPGWASGRRISRQSLLIALLKSLERETCALSDSGAAKTVLERVEKASTSIRGRRVQVHGPQACEGTTAGLDENGFLRVETAAGLVIVQTGGLREKS
jgi:BirA family transcriptional regulator, biotin operon repressor / biotin---[acetyl-CoA-carboxylase] ligase